MYISDALHCTGFDGIDGHRRSIERLKQEYWCHGPVGWRIDVYARLLMFLYSERVAQIYMELHNLYKRNDILLKSIHILEKTNDVVACWLISCQLTPVLCHPRHCSRYSIDPSRPCSTMLVRRS